MHVKGKEHPVQVFMPTGVMINPRKDQLEDVSEMYFLLRAQRVLPVSSITSFRRSRRWCFLYICMVVSPPVCEIRISHTDEEMGRLVVICAQ